ncbi:MAG: hypothetical protein HY978_00640 [Candidatus Liptonbacteria bacterium]|nr:hypothetical protein [Candidatus Liptonbacteria bacterium]
MTFRLNNLGYNLPDLARRLGYKPIATTPGGELNCVRPLSGPYPRFHVYLKADPKLLTFNIHLDQKKPSYEGATAHSGDYDSSVVQGEAERIKELIMRYS